MPRKAIFGEVAKLVTMRMYSWEKKPVKEYLKMLRREKKRELVKEKKNVKR